MKNTCRNCKQAFEVSAEDAAYYKRISPVIGGRTFAVPPPTLCPECRWQRRLASRNERALYRRQCDLSGRQIIAMHPAEVPFPVYEITEWQGDKWDALQFGRPFDFSRPFFPQFKELCDSVPHFSLFIDPLMNINSDFTNCASESKNCYLITQAEKNEDCYYSRGINRCKDCCDCLRVNGCELCYEGINLSGCYQCFYCQDCDNCATCYFSSDLRGCKHCFGCHGLSQKEYYFYNQKLSKVEWLAKIRELTFTLGNIRQWREESRKARLQVPQKAVHILQCEDVTGDHLQQCRDAKLCFDSKDLEHCAYCYEVLNGAKYSYDYSMWGITCELLYECNGCGYNAYSLLFSAHCWNNVSFLIYCDSCFPAVRNCFGCFGLRNKEYCVFNTQYTKEQYESLLPRIIEHMMASGEWGEFFPIENSGYAYNEALSNEYFPMEKAAVLAKGWRWREDDAAAAPTSGKAVPLAETIDEAREDICTEVLRCAVSKKPYRITKAEFAFYKRLGLPLPDASPDQRHKERVARRNPRHLWPRTCASCSRDIVTTYSPERPETVYCEECYLREVY